MTGTIRGITIKRGDSSDWVTCYITSDDIALIAKCHRLRSLGYAIAWSEVDRLVELLAGEPIKRRKRCDVCSGSGVIGQECIDGVWYEIEPSEAKIVGPCSSCHGTGYEEASP